MPVFAHGKYIKEAEWTRLIQSIPASYVVWKDGSTYWAECNRKGGTDYNGTNPSTVINNAIDSLTKGVVYLACDMEITEKIIPKSHVDIVNFGRRTKITLAANRPSTMKMIDLPNNATDIVISGIELDGNTANQTKPCSGISGKDVTDILIKNCYIHDHQNIGLGLVYIVTPPSIGRNIAINNLITNCDIGISFWTHEAIIQGNQVKDCNTGISIDEMCRGNCIGNIVRGGAYGIEIFSNATFNSVLGNDLLSQTSAGIWVRTASHNNIIEANIVKDATTHGILLVNDNNDYNIISSNQCYGNGGYGINIAGSTCDKNLVHGNICLGNTSGAINDGGTSTVLADNITA